MAEVAEIRVSGNLNHEEFELLITHTIRNVGKSLLIDLSDLRFIDPYGLVGLIKLARFAKMTDSEFNLT